MCVSTSVCAHRGLRSQFSPSTVRALGMELRLAASTSACGAGPEWSFEGWTQHLEFSTSFYPKEGSRRLLPGLGLIPGEPTACFQIPLQSCRWELDRGKPLPAWILLPAPLSALLMKLPLRTERSASPFKATTAAWAAEEPNLS